MKILTAPHMERCIGCFLCVLAAGNNKDTLSLNNSLIRVIAQGREFVAEIDSGIEAEEGVVASCPRNCLKIEEV